VSRAHGCISTGEGQLFQTKKISLLRAHLRSFPEPKGGGGGQSKMLREDRAAIRRKGGNVDKTLGQPAGEGENPILLQGSNTPQWEGFLKGGGGGEKRKVPHKTLCVLSIDKKLQPRPSDKSVWSPRAGHTTDGAGV